MPDDIDPRQLATSLAAGRIAIGVTFLLAPRAVWGVQLRDSPVPDAIATPLRMAAARDIALGVGGLLAARRGPGALRGWTEAGALADGTDAVVIATDRSLRPVVRLVVATGAALAAAAGRYAATRLTD